MTKEIINARLAFVGPVWEEVLANMKHQIADLGLDSNVEFTGPLYNEEKYGALKRSKVMALPSYEDTWCIAVSEAMACGCAVVAYDLPALRTVYGDAIMWARTGDTKDLAKKITLLLKNETIRKEYAHRAKLFASKLDWKNIALGEYESIKKLVPGGLC